MLPVIRISADYIIPVFFLVTSLIVVIDLLWIYRKSDQWELDQRSILDLTLGLMVGSFLGGRLFHILFEYPEYYKRFPSKIFAFWEGGFVFYGGFIGAIFLALLWWKHKGGKRAFWYYADFFAPIVSFSYVFGRIGCFLNGCCYGSFCNLPWAVDGRHPTQLYSFAWELGVLLILLGLDKKQRAYDGSLFLIWMFLHALGRFMIEFLRDDFRGPEWGLSISAWISLILMVFAGFFYMKKNPRM